MKRLLITLFIVTSFAMPVYAGQWKQDENGWRYQNDAGNYQTGWYQDADGRWYYFDEQTTYMLTNTKTPDGYNLGSDGAWQQESGESIITESYDNETNLVALAYERGPRRISHFRNPLPVTVYYNDIYNMSGDGTVEVSGIGVSKDGIAFIDLDVKSIKGYRGNLNILYRIQCADGTYVEVDSSEEFYCRADSFSTKISLLSEIRQLKDIQVPVSVEVRINDATLING